MSTWIHRLKKKTQLSLIWVNSLINNDEGNDSYIDNIVNRIITADCKKCHRSCVFAAACAVSLLSFMGFSLCEVIGVRFAFLSETLEPHVGVGVTCCNTPAALHCLWDTSQVWEGVQKKKKCPVDSLSPHLCPISPHPSSPRRGEEEGGTIICGWSNRRCRRWGRSQGHFFSRTPGWGLQSCLL